MKNLFSTGIRHIAIQVSDLNKSTDFYIKLLGAKYCGKATNMVFLMLGETDLTLEQANNSIIQPSGIDHFGFIVDRKTDVDKATSYLSENNVEVISGPADRPDARFMMFKDPDGYKFELFCPNK